MIFLTYGEPPSGVYESQVIDVCRYLSNSCDAHVKLVSFVSPRHFRFARRWIASRWETSVVLPALPRVGYWRTAAGALAMLAVASGERAIMARGVPACNMALACRRLGFVRRVCLDGRGAIAAERREYLSASEREVNRYVDLERDAVLRSDFRLAVSRRLVDYWMREYGYSREEHVVVPCTIAAVPDQTDSSVIAAMRERMGYRDDHVVLIYSGSTAGWQSFPTLEAFATRVMESQPAVRLLMLSQPDPTIDRLERRFPGRVARTRVAPEEVHPMLLAADFGLMIREESVTNTVASPTKVAEYLAAGLPVLASSSVGDYADFITQHRCGFVVSATELPSLDRPSIETRRRIREVACSFLTKDAHVDQYRRVIDHLMGPAAAHPRRWKAEA